MTAQSEFSGFAELLFRQQLSAVINLALTGLSSEGTCKHSTRHNENGLIFYPRVFAFYLLVNAEKTQEKHSDKCAHVTLLPAIVVVAAAYSSTASVFSD